MSGPRFSGTKQGVFGLCSWAPLRKPGETAALPKAVAANTASTSIEVNRSNNTGVERQQQQLQQRVVSSSDDAASINNNAVRAKQALEIKAPGPVIPGQRLIAKFNYTANRSSPLGADAELTIRQMEKMTMVAPHTEQEFWWLVELDEGGQRGYVPANYVMPFEEKVTSLPWLANKPVETPLPPTSNQPYKPYKSAYDKAGGSETSSATNQYYCKVCEKSFNGPQPYSAHMSSRGHREELELQGLL